MRVLKLLLVVVALLLGSDLAAQKNCKKGIPCGNSCISASKTCRIGSPSSAPTTPRAAASVPRAANIPAGARRPWVASTRGKLYYWVGCDAWDALDRTTLVYFKTRGEAETAGYTVSKEKYCADGPDK